MAFASVSPLAAPWQRLGLRYLLSPVDLPPELSLTAEPAAGEARPPRLGDQRSPAPQAGVSAPSREAYRPAAASANRPPVRPSGRPPVRSSEGPPTAEARREAPLPPSGGAADAARAEAEWRPLAPALWPAPWQERLARTRPGLVAWTYWTLGSDLCDGGQPGKAERGLFFRRLLQDLGHPQGTHTFWPVCLPDAGGELRADAGIFWSGLQALKARGVILMGSAAARAAALPGKLEPLSHRVFRGRRVWVLRDVDLMRDDAARYDQMLAFLQNALQSFLPR